jgi:hypothetical protein
LARHCGGESQLNLLLLRQQVPNDWVGQLLSQPPLLASAGRLLRAVQKPAATESKLFRSRSMTAMEAEAGTGTSPVKEQPLANSTLSFGRWVRISRVPLRKGLYAMPSVARWTRLNQDSGMPNLKLLLATEM